jgi:hypothetical protein
MNNYNYRSFLLLLFLSPVLFAADNSSDIRQPIREIITEIDNSADAYLSDTIRSPKTTGINRKVIKKVQLKHLPAPVVKNTITEKTSKSYAKVQSKRGNYNFDEITQRLFAWAKAWSAGNADKYINYYTPDYSAAGMSRKQWLNNRKQRISPDKNIQVEITEIDIRLVQKNKKIITFFKQSYRSIHYEDISKKQLKWQKINGEWFISLEKTIK